MRRPVRSKLGTEFKRELEAMTVEVPRRQARAARRPPEHRAVEMIDHSPRRPGPGGGLSGVHPQVNGHSRTGGNRANR